MSRPQKPIDWKVVDDLLMAGCYGTEIAEHFDMHYDTFYNRVSEQYSMGFTEYCALKRKKGDSLLRMVQYQVAIKDKNTTMLIWLGKQRLNQREPAIEHETKEENKGAFNDWLKQQKESKD